MTWTPPAGNAAHLQESIVPFAAPAGNAANMQEGYTGAGETGQVTLPVVIEVNYPRVKLPLIVQVLSSAAAVSLPVVIKVATPAAVTLSLRIVVIDAAAVGGLDGAGGWAAAPNGQWRPIVLVDGADVSGQLLGPVTVTHARDSAAVAEFAYLPAAAMQPMGLIGRPVQIAFERADGSARQRMFTGVINSPSIDLDTGAIACSCHDRAQEVWAATPRESIDAMVGGRWSVHVSGEPVDNHVYMLERIQSVAASWAIDVLQRPRIIPWSGSTRELTVRTADVIDGSLSVDLPSRGQLRTRITCRLQYRFQRLRYRGAQAQWAGDIHLFKPFISATVNYPGATWLTTSMVRGACEGVSGWQLVGDIRIEHPPARSWMIGGSASQGFYSIDARTAPELALSFSATYSTRWRQVVTEDWALTVVCPELESQVGAPVAEEIGASIESEFDQPGWESDESLEPMLSNTYGTGDVKEDWKPAGYDDDARDNALRTLLDRAWVRIWSASRSGRVRFDLPLRPDLWLDARIELEHARLRAAGDVVEISHRMDPATGEAVSAITLAVGMPGATPAALPDWALPASPADTYVPPLGANSFRIGTFVGGTSESPVFDAEAMIGFATNLNGPVIEGREYYPHQLSIRAPDIAPEDRDPLELPAVSEFAVQLPTDILEIL